MQTIRNYEQTEDGRVTCESVIQNYEFHFCTYNLLHCLWESPCTLAASGFSTVNGVIRILSRRAQSLT